MADPDYCCGECNPKELLKPAGNHGCSPGNGGIGGVLPHCPACGVMVPPPIPCDRPDCIDRVLG